MFSLRGCFLTAAAAAVCVAQLTLSTIRGTVSDPSGAPVVGADITLVNIDTSARRIVKSTDTGDFEIPDLQPGRYRLTATAPGFRTFVADDVVLESSQVRRVNASLQLGAVTQEVTVTAGVAVIATDTAKLQNAISGTKYADIPLVGAEATLDPSIVLTTVPLVSQTSGVWSSQWAGQSSTQVQEGQDGHTNDGAVNQLNDILDAQEITVVTVNNTAEFARVGYMNMVTKSGTNQFHGRAMYWHQNSALGAREFFEDTKAKQLIHTISGSVSGPIRRDKTFFYASANILKVPSKQFYLRSVPTAQMRAGDFSQLLSLARPTVIRDPLTGQPFLGNIIPTQRISSVARSVNEKYLPAPNRGGADALSNNYGFTFPFPTDYSLREDFTQRFDHHFTQKNRIMGRMIENWDKYVLPSNFETFAWTRLRYNLHLVVEDTHVFSPALVNSFRVGWYKEEVNDGQPMYGVTPFVGDEAVAAIGLQGVNPKGYSAQGFPRMDITGYPTLRTQPGGLVQDDHDWGYADTMTWSTGRHVLKFGGEYKPQKRFAGNIPEGTYGIFAFNGSFTGYGYSDFLLGLPFNSTRLDPLTNRWRRDSELGLFVTDSFKATTRLTLDLGLRWDRFGSPTYDDGLMFNWDPQSPGSITVPSDSAGSISPLYPKSIGIVTGDVRMHPKNANFVPRIGAAYRLTEKTVLRGGYGIFTETLGRYARIQGGGPFQISETYQNEITNGQPLFAFPNPFPSSLALARVPSQSVTGYPMDVDNGRIHQFNLTVERQIKDIGVRLSYVGSRNKGMNYGISVNKPQPSLIPFTADRRPYPQFVGASYFRSDGAQRFNAFTAEVQRKAGQFTFDAHWTWSSNLTNMLNLENPYAPLFWERDNFTPRHRGVINVVWELPFGRGRRLLGNAHPVVQGVAGGWQLYWIGYLETGHFFGPSFSGADPSNTNTVGGRPDRVCDGNLPADQRRVERWFDASCFTRPPNGRFGNSGTNILEGPGYNMHHLSIAKSFALTERLNFTFTAAASNVLNHPNFLTPAANISSPGTVGVVSGLVEGAKSRHIELRGRIDF
ncbi:MAG TPA: carboxypeptidase regulatory-like domain-containing protein [Bryobacteraceae bacterium]|nr:carboxypeptidase regulatory-like domain-containing protein [Bryobacteraceae bacterium]